MWLHLISSGTAEALANGSKVLVSHSMIYTHGSGGRRKLGAPWDISLGTLLVEDLLLILRG